MAAGEAQVLSLSSPLFLVRLVLLLFLVRLYGSLSLSLSLSLSRSLVSSTQLNKTSPSRKTKDDGGTKKGRKTGEKYVGGKAWLFNEGRRYLRPALGRCVGGGEEQTDSPSPPSVEKHFSTPLTTVLCACVRQHVVFIDDFLISRPIRWPSTCTHRCAMIGPPASLRWSFRYGGEKPVLDGDIKSRHGKKNGRQQTRPAARRDVFHFVSFLFLFSGRSPQPSGHLD